MKQIQCSAKLTLNQTHNIFKNFCATTKVVYLKIINFLIFPTIRYSFKKDLLSLAIFSVFYFINYFYLLVC